MTAGEDRGRPPVVVVTGGGGGIGAAIADELGRRGCHVVTMDPLVTLDGAEQLPAQEETTAGRIVAAGGSARASSVSVTDAAAVRELFAGLVDELGGLDGVVNVAGITRPTTFATGTEEDWLAVLSVHLGGYLNVLEAALPLMAAAGRGRILGVTSGSGWRAADTGAYGCAKRAVASLTWQLGRTAPPGVAVNAISPIAVTRMVTAALGRGAASGDGGRGGGKGSSSTGGLSLGSMPEPEQLGPFGAHLVADDLGWCNGRVLFAGGSEVAVIDEPRLLEVVRTGEAASLAGVLDAVTGALAKAEASQTSGGGSNPRFGPIFDDDPTIAGSSGACAVVSDRPDVAEAVTAALDARGVTSTGVDPGAGRDFAAAGAALASAAERIGPLDAVVVAPAGPGGGATAADAWQHVLAEHSGIVDGIHADAVWARAASDHAERTDRPMRLVVLTDATSAGGRSRAQAVAQHSRAALRATGDRLAALTVSVEGADAGTAGEVAAHLACSPDGPALSGAELVAGAGWIGLRSHPRPGGSVTFGGPDVPPWLDEALGAMVGGGR